MMTINAGVIGAKRKNPEFSKILNDWHEMQVKPTFYKRIIPVDLAVSEYCSILLNQRTRPLTDALIAATAHTHGLTLVTRITADFSGTGINLINPWE
jgi:predicted nucleic acid-binding protein